MCLIKDIELTEMNKLFDLVSEYKFVQQITQDDDSNSSDYFAKWGNFYLSKNKYKLFYNCLNTSEIQNYFSVFY